MKSFVWGAHFKHKERKRKKKRKKERKKDFLPLRVCVCAINRTSTTVIKQANVLVIKKTSNIIMKQAKLMVIQLSNKRINLM